MSDTPTTYTRRPGWRYVLGAQGLSPDAYGVAERRFAQALLLGRSRRIWAALWGKPTRLLSLADIGGQLIGAFQPPALADVPLDQIVGSLGRPHAFDREFYPRGTETHERWVSVAAAWWSGRPMAPVRLLRIGADLFVEDGHHRISVSRAFGATTIEALVIPAQRYLRA